jgi:hypothetical protein
MFGLFSSGGDTGGGPVSFAFGGALGGGTESWKSVSFMSANLVMSYTRISIVTPSCTCSGTTDAGTGLGALDTDTLAGFGASDMESRSGHGLPSDTDAKLMQNSCGWGEEVGTWRR